MKNPKGIFFLLLASVCLIALPAIAGSSEELVMKYEDHLSQHERLEQIADIEANKAAFAQELAARWEAEALERGNDESWLERISGVLSEEDAESLLSKSEAESWDDFIGLQTTSELVFYPLKPCRVVDTRLATRWGAFGTPVGSGQTIDVRTHTSLAKQGGATNCGVYSGSAAVVVNVTLVPVSGGQGYLTVWPYGQSRPTASLVNYNSASTSRAIANAVSQSQCRLCSNELSVYASKRTHVIIDVIGYFARNSKTPPDIMIWNTSISLPGLANRTLYASCQSGYRLTGGGCYFSNFDPGLQIIGTRATTYRSWRCDVRNNGLFTRAVYAQAVCAMIPGR